MQPPRAERGCTGGNQSWPGLATDGPMLSVSVLQACPTRVLNHACAAHLGVYPGLCAQVLLFIVSRSVFRFIVACFSVCIVCVV